MKYLCKKSLQNILSQGSFFLPLLYSLADWVHLQVHISWVYWCNFLWRTPSQAWQFAPWWMPSCTSWCCPRRPVAQPSVPILSAIRICLKRLRSSKLLCFEMMRQKSIFLEYISVILTSFIQENTLQYNQKDKPIIFFSYLIQQKNRSNKCFKWRIL